jgi:type II secretory pathway pseudopilin PulG
MRGHTLVELTFVLLLMGVAAASVAPTARQLQERAAVAAAREAVVGLLAEARLAAIETGGATVWIDSGSGLAQAIARGTTLRRVALTTDFGVTVKLSGAQPRVELRYDALGLGRMSSITIVLRRGGAAAELIVSSYGRVRRR